MEFNYGETLRIRSDLYTIQGKDALYIDTHGAYMSMSINWIKHTSNNAAFWLRWDKKRMRTSFPKLCGKSSARRYETRR